MGNDMFGSKYSKVLTIVLIVVIIGVIGLLIFLAVDAFRKSTTERESEEAVSRFEESLKPGDSSGNSGEQTNQAVNSVDPIIDPVIDENTTGGSSGGDGQGGSSSGGSGGSSGGGSGVTYKGYNVIGTIEIPKTNIKYPILDQVSIRSLEASIGYIYGQGINQVGNAVLVGHNYRNGTFFSNNKRLSKGDKIYITDTNGQKITYVITKKYETSTNDFSYATRDVKGKREISLSTCTDDTKKRLIIWAEEQ